MTFPGAGATVHRNEEGEPVGWDYPGDYMADEMDDRDDYPLWDWEPDDEPVEGP